MKTNNIVRWTSFVFAIILCFNYGIISAASSKSPDRLKRRTVISGQINLTEVTDTVKLSVLKNFVYNMLGMDVVFCRPDSLGKFKFIFEIAHPAQFSLTVTPANKIRLSNFYIEPGDSVFIGCIRTQEENNFTFSGKGKQNLKFVSAIDSITKHLLFHPPLMQPPVVTQDTLVTQLQKAIFLDANSRRVQLQLLQEYKGLLSPLMFSLFKTNITGASYTGLCTFTTYLVKKASENQIGLLKQIFYNKIYDKEGSFDNSTIIYSGKFIEFLFRQSQAILSINKKTSYKMKDLVAFIVNKFKGDLRESILLAYLLRGQQVSTEEYEYSLQKALSVVNTSWRRRYLIAQMERLGKGVEAYDFNLPSFNGKQVRLSNFRGKVVLMDFWFTGCYSCIKLSKDIHQFVLPKFDTSSFVLVSISLDKDREQWIKGVRGGLYTDISTLNLFTEGLAFQHPLVRHYNIQGCPTVILVDRKGKIFSGKPPHNTEALMALIKTAIAQ